MENLQPSLHQTSNCNFAATSAAIYVCGSALRNNGGHGARNQTFISYEAVIDACALLGLRQCTLLAMMLLLVPAHFMGSSSGLAPPLHNDGRQVRVGNAKI